MNTTTPHPMALLAARVITAAVLAVGALTISSGDARAIPLEGDNDHGVYAVTSSGTVYVVAAKVAPLSGRLAARGGVQEH